MLGNLHIPIFSDSDVEGRWLGDEFREGFVLHRLGHVFFSPKMMEE